ncbi:MAG: type VI secretion system tip protein VgrG [bacterium]|nr:type VI secretion system tip protein VgrG [bacterium]
MARQIQRHPDDPPGGSPGGTQGGPAPSGSGGRNLNIVPNTGQAEGQPSGGPAQGGGAQGPAPQGAAASGPKPSAGGPAGVQPASSQKPAAAQSGGGFQGATGPAAAQGGKPTVGQAAASRLGGGGLATGGPATAAGSRPGQAAGAPRVGQSQAIGVGTIQTSSQTLKASQSDFSFRAADLDIHELRVVSIKVTEGISRLFNVRLDLASKNREIDLDSLVGKPGVLRIANAQPENDRFINGIVSRLEFTGEGVRFARYELELVPFIWLLDLRAKCRIFQEMTAPEIIQQVLRDAGLPSDMMRVSLTKTYAKREYCVQYRETELDFIQRLMEEEGIFYFFEHTEDNHVLVMGDASSVHKTIAGKTTVIFRGPSQMVEKEEFFSHFRTGQQVRPGAVMLRDFEFKQPKLNLQAEKKAQRDDVLEIYDYPGEYKEPGVGKQLAQVRLEEYQTNRKVASGVSVCRRMIPGYRFTLGDHVREDCNIEYLITAVTHRATQAQTLEEEPAATVPEGPLYENTVEAIPFEIPFRPPRVTPRPIVHGTQTAIVVGPSGEEIYTDSHGRVKVHFHWDREGVFDEKASCWIRVSQNWAGGKYGSIFLPRIAHEVIVDFLEGDPDQPIIVGRVYNGDERTPYNLPDEKTKSTIRTANSKGQDGANELRFEDKKGEEQIFLHAEKDLHIRVKNDRLANIGHDSHLTIENEHREEVKGNRSRKVGGDEAIEVGGTRSVKVGGDVIEQFDANHKEKTASNYFLQANQVVIKASSGISLVCGGNHVTVDPSGVTIVGSMVKINSGGAALSDSAGNPSGPGAPEAADTESPGKDTSYSGESRQQQAIPVEKLEKKSWIEIELKDEAGRPVPGEYYLIKTSDERELDGTLDANGRARLDGIEPGQCEISFPNRHPDEWRKG